MTVEFADEVEGGNANAEIQGNRITIEKWNQNPVRALFGHEITHRIQELSADSYAEYKAAAREMSLTAARSTGRSKPTMRCCVN